MRELFQSLDGALYVRHDEATDHLLVWYGGDNVRVFNPDGECTIFAIGPFTRDVRLEDAQYEIETALKSHDYMALLETIRIEEARDESAA